LNSLKQQSGRFLFLDIFRAVSIFLMLQGHTFRALLDNVHRTSIWFEVHEFIHGLTAPAFLVSAGLTFGISTFKRSEDYFHPSRVFFKRIGKFFVILLLGYAIHLPKLSLNQILTASTYYDYLSLTQVDVLQCIGITLLFSQVFLFFMKDEKKFLRMIFSVTGIILLATPLLQDQRFLKSLPLSVSQYLDIYNGSSFPLFPNAVFIFAGIMLSKLFLQCSSEDIPRFFKRISVAGIIVAAIAAIAYFLPIQLYPINDFWKTSPNFVLVRFGCVLLLFSAVWYATTRLESIPSIVPMMGKESLFIYVFHLPIIYGSPVNSQSLTFFFGPTLHPFQATFIFIAVTVAVIYSSKLWSFLKHHRTNMYRTLQIGMATAFLVLFLTL